MAVNGTIKRGKRLIRSWLGSFRGESREKQGEPTLSPSPEATREAIEQLVGMQINNLEIYIHALKHRSIFRGHITKGTESNERLEFLGDAVLGAVVAERLYEEFPDRDEGFLTRMRANLVNGKVLADYARAIDLGSMILMSENMASSAGRDNQTILADAFEAIVGAVYVDLGFWSARQFVYRLLDQLVDLEQVAVRRSNYKSLLLEYVQARGWGQPSYAVVREEGPSHNRNFTIEVLVGGTSHGQGSAGSKKEAEQLAARKALDKFRSEEHG